jgi:hypothetical protein
MIPLTTELLPPPCEVEFVDSDIEDHSDSETEDDNDDILPPTVHHQPGRPSNARKEAAKRRDKNTKKKGGEIRAFRCSLCNELGHSKRIYKNPID